MSTPKAITAFPLAWPAGWKRSTSLKYGRFGTRATRPGNAWQTKSAMTVAGAVARVRTEVGRMGLRDDDVVISTNLKLRLDGLPRSDQREPDDAGAAVYWIDRGGATRCMAIDRYEKVADNLAAIAATLDAMRAIERHGGAEILDRAFTGFTALPSPASANPWHVVLGCGAHASTEEVRAIYRKARSAAHPDNGGAAGAFDEIQSAWNAFTAQRGLTE